MTKAKKTNALRVLLAFVLSVGDHSAKIIHDLTPSSKLPDNDLIFTIDLDDGKASATNWNYVVKFLTGKLTMFDRTRTLLLGLLPELHKSKSVLDNQRSMLVSSIRHAKEQLQLQQQQLKQQQLQPGMR